MPISLKDLPSRKLAPAPVIDFLLHDPALTLMDGLFRAIEPELVEAHSVALRLRYHHNPDFCVDVEAPRLLSGNELAVLQGLLRLSMVEGETIAVPAEDGQALPDEQQDLVAELNATSTLKKLEEDQPAQLPARQVIGEFAKPSDTPDKLAPADEVQYLAFPVGKLLEAIGWPVNGQHRDIALKALRNLAGVTLVVTSRKRKSFCQAFRLLSALTTNAGSKKYARVHVGLNPRLTEVLVGKDPAHTRLYNDEFEKLGTHQVARILHQRLSAFVGGGEQRAVLLSTLREYAFPNDVPARTLAAARDKSDPAYALLTPEDIEDQQNRQIVSALTKIESRTGWYFKMSRSTDPTRPGEPLVIIQRPKRRITQEELAEIRLRQARRRSLKGAPLVDGPAGSDTRVS